MFNIVLYEPEIPANTGNIGRSCVLTGSRLHLIGPLGFSLDNHLLHRAGLGYWDSLDVSVYKSWADFLSQNGLKDKSPEPKLHLFTKKARRSYSESHYSDGDYLVLGKESTGIPDEILVALPESCERIPMLPDAASLKNADAWAARGPAHDHSSLKRQDICGNFIDFENYHISSLNLSNATSIVLYEALRQNGFPGMDVVGNKE